MRRGNPRGARPPPPECLECAVQTHGTVHFPGAFVSCSTYDAGRSDGSLEFTLSVKVGPLRTPENVAGGAGVMLTGPASMR
jgi:hypothetical protein